MTTDIERQFFDTFGIEPEYQDRCKVEDKYWQNEELANKYGTFDQYMNAKCGNQEDCTTECSCAYQKEIYPQITDRILLELLCLINQVDMYYYGEEEFYTGFNYDNFKQEIISKCKRLADKNAFSEVTGENFKKQVQALFKEG